MFEQLSELLNVEKNFFEQESLFTQAWSEQIGKLMALGNNRRVSKPAVYVNTQNGLIDEATKSHFRNHPRIVMDAEREEDDYGFGGLGFMNPMEIRRIIQQVNVNPT